MFLHFRVLKRDSFDINLIILFELLFFADLLAWVKTEIGCWMYTGERQACPLRDNYLEVVLKQDVGFFDTDAKTGDIVFSVSTDISLCKMPSVRRFSFVFSDLFYLHHFTSPSHRRGIDWAV